MRTMIEVAISFIIGMLGTYTLLDIAHNLIQRRRRKELLIPTLYTK